MSIPPISIIESAAKKLVWAAQKNGTLEELTPRLIRQKVEKECELGEGVLDASEYKRAVKAAAQYALDNDPPQSDGEGTKSEPAPRNKRKSSGMKDEPEEAPETPMAKAKAKPKAKVESKEDTETPTTKAKAKPKPKSKAKVEQEKDTEISKTKARAKAKAKPTPKVVVSDDDGSDAEPAPKKRKVGPKSKQNVSEDEDNYDDEPSASSPKKQPSRTVTKAKAEKVISEDEDEEPTEVLSAPKSRTKNNSKAYKSLEHVATSDMEQDEPEPAAGPSVVKPSTPAKADKTPRKAKVVVDSDSTPGRPLSRQKTGGTTAPKSTDVEMEDGPEKSESELSVLIDEPPKRKRKSSTGDKTSKKASEKPKPKRAAKTAVALSKDEETIKRLKSLVVACGTRKVWSKVFQDLDTPQQQIKKLKEMLADLGMTGRLSLEQAKAIKEKRELEKELADVTEFAAKMEAAPNRGAKSKSADPDNSADEDKNDSSEGEEEEVQAPRRGAMNARKSIMAFLGDQSDDE